MDCRPKGGKAREQPRDPVLEKKHRQFRADSVAVQENAELSNVLPAMGSDSLFVRLEHPQVGRARRVGDLAMAHWPALFARGLGCGGHSSAPRVTDEDFRAVGPAMERGGQVNERFQRVVDAPGRGMQKTNVFCFRIALALQGRCCARNVTAPFRNG